MSSFRVEGGHPLAGEITPQGAKNEALQILSAVLLTDQEVIVRKIPQIRDVLKLIDLLGDLGVETERLDGESFSFKAANIDLDFLDTQEFKEKASALRGSIMILGPLLARFGKGKMPKPHPCCPVICKRRSVTVLGRIDNVASASCPNQFTELRKTSPFNCWLKEPSPAKEEFPITTKRDSAA